MPFGLSGNGSAREGLPPSFMRILLRPGQGTIIGTLALALVCEAISSSACENLPTGRQMQSGNAPAGCRATEPPAPPAIVRLRHFQSDAVVLRLVVYAIMETDPGLVLCRQVRLVANAVDFLATGHACPAQRARAPLPGPYISVSNQLIDVQGQAVLDRGPAATPMPTRPKPAHFTPAPFLTKSLGNFASPIWPSSRHLEYTPRSIPLLPICYLVSLTQDMTGLCNR